MCDGREQQDARVKHQPCSLLDMLEPRLWREQQKDKWPNSFPTNDGFTRDLRGRVTRGNAGRTHSVQRGFVPRVLWRPCASSTCDPPVVSNRSFLPGWSSAMSSKAGGQPIGSTPADVLLSRPTIQVLVHALGCLGGCFFLIEPTASSGHEPVRH